ncbi:LuxR C-terminal-related transcriptional regulator [Ramlibacter sp. WS9]|uniref:LuxR C-terminal-related transcriptional regulator n=1 Tax=Ramlibacter sp. WS9 TaxID=1882741 RepID=UPI00114134AE|nr:LuxR C-terminal-related transcriptional regulator [Ramlibacter sp. WS9]
MADSLFACLDHVDRSLAREAAFVYNRNGGAPTWEPAAIALIRALTKHPRDLVLMIDDYHLITDEDAHRFVQMLLDFAPPNFHLLLASRSAPSLSLARLRDKSEILELGFSDLRFSLSETEELLYGQNASLPPRDVRSLHELTDGWVAGLRLVAMTMRNQSDRAWVGPLGRLQNPSDFNAYFHQNVLATLPDCDVDALCRLAVASRFDEGVCTALFGDDAGQALFERLRRDNLFLIPVEGVKGCSWYRFHPLFRDELNSLFDSLPDAERRSTHSRLAESFGRRTQLREAVHHSVAAGEVEKAADWVDRYAKSMFLHGDLRRLVRAVAELPSPALHSRPSLRLWVAWAQLCYRKLDECGQSIEDLRASLPADDENAQHHLTLLEASLALQQDDTEAARRLLPALDAMTTAQDAILSGGRRNILGWYHGQLNHGSVARLHLAGRHFFLEGGEPLLDSAFGFLVGECLRGHSYVKEGNMREGERALREVLGKSEKMFGPFCEGAANAAGFLGTVLYEIDELPALRVLLEPRMDLIERAGLPDAVIMASLMLTRMYQAEGSFQEALAGADRLEEIARRRGLDRMLALALNERVAIQLKMGDVASAQGTVAQISAVASRQGGRTSNSALAVWWHERFARAELLAALRREQEAIEALHELMSSSLFEDKLQARAQVFARAAILQRRLRREPEALRHSAQAWTIAQRMGLMRSMLDLGPEVLSLGQDASRGQLLDDAAQFHLERVAQRAHLNQSRVAPPPMPTHGRLSSREVAIIKALSAALPNKRIAQALEISPETVKWHLKNVYSKLGVYARDGAVKRARELGYLEPGR